MADNAVEPRRFMVILQLVTALVLLIEVGLLIPDPSDRVSEQIYLSCDVCLLLLQAGIEIINLMQLFNWFSKKYLGTVISIWLMSSNLGFMMQFFVGGWW